MAKSANFLDDDVDDVISNSQPLSLPPSQSSATENIYNEGIGQLGHEMRVRPLKHTGQQGEFRSIEEVDPKYRFIFTYPYFNLVQSRVIEDALYSDKSMVVCAPTGSGKTVVFEMAIVQLLMDMEEKNYTDFKIIYMAPVKALCTERLTEWYPKFTKLGLLCIEVTGDTDVDFPQLKPYSIIITTPEKWDMLTRRWRDHRGLVEVVKLFLIDEVHILNDLVRGPVLEAVVSRMKTIESTVQTDHRIEQVKKKYQCNQAKEAISISSPPRIRFVAVSATVNNPEDVATWLGTKDRPAVYYKFGDECRPVKLNRVVEGYPCSAGTSIFKFDIILNYKLWPIIQKYYNGKPTLIFCNTRKSVALTAEALSREITITFNPEQKAKLTALASTIKNKKLQTLIVNGVGCHHAGLLFEERMNIELAFRNRDLPILVTTTTLAMGVNLPAHLVIVKNTQQYVNGAYQEYSMSTILQMVGRAGRPQFDTEATAVIMTRMADVARYKAMVIGTDPLQSFLHKRLAENLNSEVALGTVTHVAQCVQWVDSTFLSVRATKDPKRYLGLPQDAPINQVKKKIEELCVKAMNGLASAGLITMVETTCIESTEAGKLMSVYYIDLETMKLIMKIEGSETIDSLLWLICDCHELSDMHLRMDERRNLNALNRNNSAATIRFPMKGKINTRQMKSYCAIQAVLGCLPIPDPSLNQEAMKIMRIVSRVCMCLVAYTTRRTSICQQSKTFLAVLNSIILTKCITSQLWEISPYVSKQLKGIGPAFSTLLASAGKTNFLLLEESHPRDLERIMNKGPPAGNIIRKQVSLLPKYQLAITPIDRDRILIQLSLLNQAYLSENIDHLTAGANHKNYILVGDSENYILYLNYFKDVDFINIYDGCITCEVTRKHNYEHKIKAYCVSSTFVGIDVKSEYTFMNIGPICPIIADSNINNDNKVVETVNKREFTDRSKTAERKRKINHDEDSTTCCKEKLKRENNLLEKFKRLNESYGKTRKEMMGNINRTTELSNNALQEVTLPSTTNSNRQDTLINTIDVGDDPEKYEVSEDDDEVDKILEEIENELNKTKNVQALVHNPTLPKDRLKNYTLTDNKQNFKTINRRNKCKFNFNDDLEKNNYNNEVDQDILRLNNDEGLTNTIKIQINKYLQNVKESTNKYEDITYLLQNDDGAENVNSDCKIPGDSKVDAILTDYSSCHDDTSIIQNVKHSVNKLTVSRNQEGFIKGLNKEKEDKNHNEIVAKAVYICDDQSSLIDCYQDTSPLNEILSVSSHEYNDILDGKNTNENKKNIDATDNFLLIEDSHQNRHEEIFNPDTTNTEYKHELAKYVQNNLDDTEVEKINLVDFKTRTLQNINISESGIADLWKPEERNDVPGTDNVNTIDDDHQNKMYEYEEIETQTKNYELDVDNIIKHNKVETITTTNNKDVDKRMFTKAIIFQKIDIGEGVLAEVERDHSDEILIPKSTLIPLETIPSTNNNTSHNKMCTQNKSAVASKNNCENLKPEVNDTRENYLAKFSITEKQYKVSAKYDCQYTLKVTRTLDIDLNITKPISTKTDKHIGDKCIEPNNNIPNSLFKLVNYQLQTMIGNNKNPNENKKISSTLQRFNKRTEVRKPNQANTDNNKFEGNMKSVRGQEVLVTTKEISKSFIGNTFDVNLNSAPVQKLSSVSQGAVNKTNAENYTVDDIIKKYRGIMNSKHSTPVPVTKQINDNKTVRSTVYRPKRKYKISDIQNIQVPLQNFIIPTIPDTKSIGKSNRQIVERSQNYLGKDNTLSHNSKCSDIKDDIKAPTRTELSCDANGNLEINSPTKESESDETCILNQYLFDPKTLLQCYTSNDDSEVIPPPDEFSDYCDIPHLQINSTSTYTPSSPDYEPATYHMNTDENQIYNTESENLSNIYNDYSGDVELTPNYKTENKEDSRNIFNDITHDIELTRSNEMETWTLHRKDSGIMQHPAKSHTGMRQKTRDIKAALMYNSRHAKLTEFKFSRKNSLRFKK